MDDYVKLILLGLSMGAGMMLILRFGKQWFRKKPSVNMHMWMHEIERASAEAISANLYAVQSNAYLFNLVGQVPSDFEPTIFLTANLAANLQRAVLLQAEAEGLVPPGVLARVYGETSASDTASQRTLSDPSSAGEPSLRLVAEDEGHAHARAPVRWEGNRLVPRGGKRP